MNREWVSAEGNLFTTILLSPDCDLATASQLSFVASLAVAETLEAIVPTPSSIACKWPNDILSDGKKLGGILLESFSAKGRQWISVGVGVNVDSFPEHVMFPATCLHAAGVELISAKIVLSRFVYHFIHRYDQWVHDGFGPIEKGWLERAYHLNKPIEMIVGDTRLDGVFAGINSAGQLLLRDVASAIHTVTAGDVFFKD
jgi:BirA family biotin operon repressor/biotin-[acetyl-CoA-carboxylase] ligase